MCTKFGTGVEVSDVINCDKCSGDRLRGVDSAGGRKLLFLIDKTSRREHRAGATAQPVMTTRRPASADRTARRQGQVVEVNVA